MTLSTQQSMDLLGSTMKSPIPLAILFPFLALAQPEKAAAMGTMGVAEPH